METKRGDVKSKALGLLSERLKRIDFRNSVDYDQAELVKRMCECLILSDDQLCKVMELLLNEMEKGLDSRTNKTAAVKMLPSFVRSVPNGTEQGNFLALDLGGTNFRVLLITIKGNNSKMIGKIYRVPDVIMKGTGEALFNLIAESLAEFVHANHLGDKGNLPLGFTFSFACSQTDLTSAKLIKWTKGFNASGVEDKDVVQLLREACERRKDITIDVVAVLNDTVGTLMACAFKENSCQIGVIVGTGSNACYMEKLSRCEKLKSINPDVDGLPDEMILNMEWGALGDDGTLDFVRIPFDHEVDQSTINQGKQLFEKMISGMYMGEIVRVVLVNLAKEKLIFEGNWEMISKPQTFPTKYVSEIESETIGDRDNAHQKTMQILEDIGVKEPTIFDCVTVAYVCSLVSTRAAYLCAAGISTLLQRIGKPFVTIGVDGSVYRFHPTFPKLLEQKIADLIDPKLKFRLMLSQDGSGRGAALVAAVATRMKEEKKIKISS